MRVENQTKIWVWEDSSLSPETSTKNAIQEFHLWTCCLCTGAGLCWLNIRLPPEPVFANLLRSPGIDSQPSGPVWQPYLSYRPAMLHRLAESNPRNRILVFLKVYKYGLCTQRKLAPFSHIHSYCTRSTSISLPQLCFHPLTVHRASYW